jgi:hypothetical protein
MGCDIIIRTEVKRNGKWTSGDLYKKTGKEFQIIEIYDGRSYSLFTILADVRNYNKVMKPISKPRGIPEDASEEYKKLCESWGVDGHSHSYLTLQEMEEFFDKRHEWTEVNQSFISLVDRLRNRLKEHYPYDYSDHTEDIRIVFFFDN